MNVFRLLIALVFLVAGLVVGSLNSQRILISFGFTDISTTTGVAIIVSLLAGVLIGGIIVLVAMALPMYARLRRAEKALAAELQAQQARAAMPAAQAPVDGL